MNKDFFRDLQKLNVTGLNRVLVDAVMSLYEQNEVMYKALSKYRLNQIPTVNSSSIAEEAMLNIERIEKLNHQVEEL